MALEMWRPMSVRMEHPKELMIPDILTATGTPSKSATSRECFRLFKSSGVHDAEPGIKMVVCMLLAENESVYVASRGQCLATFEGRRRHSIWSSVVAPNKTNQFENRVKAGGVQ